MSFFDSFAGMFGPGKNPNRQRDDDDPIILDVRTDGEAPDDEPRADKGSSGRQPPSKRIKGAAGRHFSWGRALGLLVVVLIVIATLFVLLARFATDVMWYSQLGFASVIWTQLGVKVGLWIAYALMMAAVTYVSATLAIRARPDASDGSKIRVRGDVIEIGKGVSSRFARRIAVVVSLIVGLLFGSQFNTEWSQILLMFNGQSFGVKDPQFGIDNGFYVFVLPGLQLLVRALLVLLLAALVFSLVTHVLMGAVRLTMPVQGRGIVNMTKRSRRQLGIWLMLTMMVWAVSRLLGVFDLLFEQGDRITGASYTSVHATVPVSIVLAVLIAVLGIVLGIWIMKAKGLGESSQPASSAMAAFRQWRTPVIAISVVLVVAIALSGVWPMLLQRFKVNPNAQELESTYIQRNIDATKSAYGLSALKSDSYQATTTGESGALAQDAETTAQIRLLDPQVVSPTFRQLQQSKQYYNFEDTLAVDKYDIDGTSQDTVIGARELNLAGNDNRNWVNDHTVYTHGYGVVAAYGNKVTADGQPEFFEQGIPTQGKLTDSEHYEPRIYFSPNAPEYSIVGASKGTKAWEFDYPTGSEGATNTFSGNGGPSVGNLASRLMYAIRFNSDQILFSDRVTADSQILYDRSPKERVAKVAPYLTLDGRVYPAVVNGRVKWIVDGYTTSSNYPYSQTVDLGSSTQDSTTKTSNTIQSLGSQNVNYMRNSVKATVDAYDGSVDLYAWDPSDPVLKAWQQVFPQQYKPVSQISGDLMSHLRYPESMFKVQRQLLAKYHVSSASQFFSGEDFWQTPIDPVESKENQAEGVLQPPYYLTMQNQGAAEPTFSLTSSYIPAGSVTREILTGFLSVDSDAGNTAGKIGPNYGTLRLMELPKNSNVPGPGQAQNNFNANADVSKELNLLESGSTNVKRGNLLTLPIGGGLVYIEPVYVESSGKTSFPLLKKVLVAFGDQVGFADTLDQALDQVFGGDSGASAGDAANSSGTSTTPGTSSQADGSAKGGDSGKSNAAGTQRSAELQKALDDANQAIKDSDAALQKGDFSAYGEAQQRLKEAVNKAVEAQQGE
ncbi:UPF0182 family membrane protein [Bifidobacterium crudilactis]|jgi:uncharacterized protein|uniref:UPF0182 protein GXW98_08565 n=1 Tax=Bifidobacterium crudilactis TaxID=327277 RepID=A0A971IDV1_9BIFI|nr:UPF0182 family protein [Bifidobacterium crudilactis]MCI1867696.1 UPF0182 family protein [Bifidobacterium crudilactis]MDN5971865.1 UPF0182 family protein [Bifidobacterium crudilactis]MDN6001116.1 UPF0182 family protein [Bifidobacterium crudilactis]MDN6466709.1 UPF0182 family protein [Bifidobacterium crudilactis]MDN6558126.1 UPF0182 family protein [Bifidobacterium crudilactis]